MFPLRDENPTVHASFATFALIGANLACWLWVQGAGFHPALLKSICQFGAIPAELLGFVQQATRIPLGGEFYCGIDGNPDYRTVITSMFMHGGWFHLIMNMWFLFVFGDNIEDAMGPVRFIFFYLICGIAALASQLWFHAASVVPMVGASGAIGGVMGGYALLYPRIRVHLLIFLGFFFTRIRVPAFLLLFYWFLLQFVSGYFSLGSAATGVAFWAHIGGFIAGILLVRFFCNSERLARCKMKRTNIK